MTHLSHFGHNKNIALNPKQTLSPIFNMCHQVKFHKNSMNIFSKKLKNAGLVPKNVLFVTLWA